MIISITDCCIDNTFVSFSGALHLSKNRAIDKLKERFITIVIEVNGNKHYGRGNLFDSLQWAHPFHIYPDADRELDKLFFLEGTSYLQKQLLGKNHNNIFELDYILVELANDFTKSFYQRYDYKVSPIMPMMLAAPFSIALFSAFEDFFNLRNGDNFLVKIVETDDFKQFLFRQTGLKLKKITKNTLHAIPWLMTVNLSFDEIQLQESLEEWNPKFVKIKLDSDDKLIEKTLSRMSFLYDEYGLQFYIDCNQSFSSIEKLKGFFWDRLIKDYKHLSKNILGIEEPCFNPVTEDTNTINNFPVPLYLDENNVSIEDAKVLVSKGYNLVLKHTKPISVLLVQHQIASHYKASCAVQDLTFSHNAYFANLALYNFIKPKIPFEANYIQFVDKNWGTPFSQEYRSKINVLNGEIKIDKNSMLSVFPKIRKGGLS